MIWPTFFGQPLIEQPLLKLKEGFLH